MRVAQGGQGMGRSPSFAGSSASPSPAIRINVLQLCLRVPVFKFVTAQGRSEESLVMVLARMTGLEVDQIRQQSLVLMTTQFVNTIALDTALGKVQFPPVAQDLLAHVSENLLVIIPRDIFEEKDGTERLLLLDSNWAPLSWNATLEVLNSCTSIVRLVGILAKTLPRITWQRGDAETRFQLMASQSVINSIKPDEDLSKLVSEADKIFYGAEDKKSWLDCFNRKSVEENLARLSTILKSPRPELKWNMDDDTTSSPLSESQAAQMTERLLQASQHISSYSSHSNSQDLSQSAQTIISETVREAYQNIVSVLNYMLLRMSFARQDRALLDLHKARLIDEAKLAKDYQRLLHAPRICTTVRTELNGLKRIIRDFSSTRLSDADLRLVPNVFAQELGQARKSAVATISYGDSSTQVDVRPVTLAIPSLASPSTSLLSHPSTSPYATAYSAGSAYSSASTASLPMSVASPASSSHALAPTHAQPTNLGQSLQRSLSEAEYRRSMSHIDRTLRDTQRKAAQLSSENAQLQALVAQLQAENAKLLTQQASKQAEDKAQWEVDKARLEADNEQLRTRLVTLQSDHSQLSNTLLQSQSGSDQIRQICAQMEHRIAQLEQEVQQSRVENTALRASKKQLVDEVVVLESQLESSSASTSKLVDLQREMEALAQARAIEKKSHEEALAQQQATVVQLVKETQRLDQLTKKTTQRVAELEAALTENELQLSEKESTIISQADVIQIMKDQHRMVEEDARLARSLHDESSPGVDPADVEMQSMDKDTLLKFARDIMAQKRNAEELLVSLRANIKLKEEMLSNQFEALLRQQSLHTSKD